MTQPKLLLLSPAFHGYWKAIQASLEVHGYEVRTHIYDAPGTLPERILNKLAHELPEKYRPESFAAQATRKAIDAFNEFRPDIVLVITVSYTHLDVYKRQGSESILLSGR